MKKIIIALSLLFSVNAFAIDQMYNWNGLEFVTSGNVTHVHPASPESTRLRGGWVVEFPEDQPEIRAKHQLPYKNKGGAGAVIEVRPKVDPAKVAQRAKDALKAAAGAAAGGNPYVTVAALACGVFCDALIEWGVDQLKQDEFGDYGVPAIDTDSFEPSTGYRWVNDFWNGFYLSPMEACNRAKYSGADVVTGIRWVSATFGYCQITSPKGIISEPTVFANGPSDCPVGNYISNGSCVADAPVVIQPLETYLESNYTGKGWNHYWAKMTAEAVKNGANVFTDGTSVSITGPALVPLTVTERKTGVRLLPNTTTIAPSTYDGPTESGTQTETTTTSAKNIYQSAPFGQNTGPSVKTSTQAQTVTTITNNVTNVTNIVNETTTETDEAPEETVSDSPMPDLPELYEQKYKDGLTGVVTAKIAELKQTPLFQLPNSLMGDLPSSGQCPAWQLDLNFASWANFGIHSIGADCAIWDFAALIVLISAAILCRALIFGG